MNYSEEFLKRKEVTIGIDLGTRYSRVGVWQKDHVQIISNQQGNRSTPSCVTFTNTERLIGAAGLLAIDPNNTACCVKRLVGKNFADESVQRFIQARPFPSVVCADDNKPLLEVQFMGKTKRFYPEEICGMILSKLRDVAEHHIGKAVGAAVIGVPSHFNYHQRKAIQDAATIAGLKTKRIVSEQSVVGLTYCLHNKSCLQTLFRTVLVFDLGSGSLGVSLFNVDGGVVEVFAMGGDPNLGGEDFDNQMVNYFMQEFERKNGGKDVVWNERALVRLRNACERAKRTLSYATLALIEIDELFPGINFYTSITRTKFEELNKYLFEACLEPVRQILKDYPYDDLYVDEVVLVGGCSRIPKIQQLLQQLFNGKKLNTNFNPEEAVVCGAAIQGAILGLMPGHDDELADVLLSTATPFSIGVETPTAGFVLGASPVADGAVATLVHRNTCVPCKKTASFSTYSDNQADALIRIYEGERTMARDNNFLGEFRVPLTPPAPQAQIMITCDLDGEGAICFSAQVLGSTTSPHVFVINTGLLSKEQVDRMTREAETYALGDEQFKQRIDAKHRLEAAVYEMKNKIQAGPKVGLGYSMECGAVINAIEETLCWLDSNQNAEKQEYEYRIRTFEDLLLTLHPDW